MEDKMKPIDFQSSYRRSEYLKFLRTSFLPEDLEEFDEDLNYHTEHIQSACKIGNVPSLDLTIYEIHHKSENDPRVSISRDAFRLLSQYGKSKALIFFTSKKQSNFRFSLVTVDLKWEEGKRVTKEYSNPKRYSFYLGPDTKTHTPEEYLIKKGRVKDFENLKNRFSIEVVNKEFYTKIAVLFTKLAGGKRAIGREKFDETPALALPSTQDEKIRKEFTVRLIGRLVFCWFLKKKHSDAGISLLPDELVSSVAVQNNKNYYHNILEPLFFQALNTPVTERKKQFKSNLWKTIPFLNGGLFSPHNHDFYEPGTMEISKHINTLKIPNEWFLKLFREFETYNFTIDENTSIDVELSIDPEMLGRIFENLLAEINPETGETARKATGSYYTPRPIVEYMVDQSLKEYLLTKTSVSEKKIIDLLAYEKDAVDLKDNEMSEIINALDTIKIIDPACGSGAFPMGILQKMLLVLQKIDPESSEWLNKQISKIENIDMRKKTKEKFIGENVNYIHKIGIIQNAIYGVDIQPIAIEISKLRFFLSLIVDEKVDDAKENRGIEPLPNLEFKFVCANSLIGLPKNNEQQSFFELDDDIVLLKNLRNEYLRSWGSEKKRIEKKFTETQNRMFQHSLGWGGKDSQTLKLSQWNPFSDEACAWFDMEWMFGITSPSHTGEGKGEGGFDVVIANPPYGAGIDEEVKLLVATYKFYDRQKNSASFFIELATHIINKNGIITYIVPKSLSFSEGWGKTRNLIVEKNQLFAIIDVTKAFEEVLLEQVIVSYGFKKSENYKFYVGENWDSEIKIIGKINNNLIKQLDILPIYIDYKKLGILNKLNKNSILLLNISETFRGLPLQSKISKEGLPILRGRNIAKYKKYRDIDKIKLTLEQKNNKKIQSLLHPKIISQNIVAHVLKPNDRIIIMATIDKDSSLTLDTVMNTFITDECFSIEYVLAILNSKLAEWFYYWFVYNRAIRTMHFDNYYMGKLPVKKISIDEQQPFINLVDKILSTTKDADYPDNSTKQAKVHDYEHQIDQMVYELYGLTEEEIKIVENSKE